jgi:hypothetical protein
VNPHRVVSKEEFESELRAAGYTATNRTTKTGAFWKSKTGKHLLVPYDYEGMYPDFILKDVRARMLVCSRDPYA